ncbi:hypothetical protein [Companilactobacillus kedongensis]|uniref:hypothetical protein n=1 Tax=Companilactobacillus kedongensis TaxID=2486004 RepID=UPI000F792A1C|nr:hypothetical protein [Companilactobacillus kedongensis]
MVKLAFKQDSDGNITDVAEYPSSLYQNKSKGWIVVEDEPAFSIDEKFLWTIRPSDNVLVHKSTNMTPGEEHNDVLTKLTLQNLQLTKIIEDLKTALTTSTKQNLSLMADNADQKNTSDELQSAVTQLTKEVIGIKAAQEPDTTSADTDTSTTTDNGGK